MTPLSDLQTQTLPIQGIRSAHLLPLPSSPTLGSRGFTGRDRNANCSCSEADAIICMQLDDSHNIVLLGKQALKKIRRGGGWPLHVDPVPLKGLLSECFSPPSFTRPDHRRFYHIFMPLRYTELISVHREPQPHWYARQKDCLTSGYNDSLVTAEVTLDPPLSHSNPYLFCNLTRLSQHGCLWLLKHLPC